MVGGSGQTEVAPHHVLVKVDRAGICGTDLRYKWDDWASKTVRYLVVGHEFVGKIVEVGSRIIQPGEWVSGEGPRRMDVVATAWHGVLCSDTAVPGSPDRCLRRTHRPAPDQRLGPQTGNRSHAAAIFDPFGNAAHSALTSTPLERTP